MKQLIVTLLFLGIISLRGYCQDMYKGYGQTKPVYIKLQKVKKDHQRIDPAFQIEQVIDSTNSYGVMGVVQKGGKNRPIKFRSSFVDEFNKFINSRFYVNPYGKKLVLVISAIKIPEAKRTVKNAQIVLRIKYFENDILYHSDMSASKEGDQFLTLPGPDGVARFQYTGTNYSKSLSDMIEQSLLNLSDIIDERKK